MLLGKFGAFLSEKMHAPAEATKTADEVIRKLKAHLARHGIPDQLVSDNRQPFVPDKFGEFASTYSFEHMTSSPTCAQSNRKVENAVMTAKSLLKKAL